MTASNVDGIATQTSTPTLMISPDPPASLSPPTITGAAQRTNTLTATLGTWTGPDNIYTYQWQRDAGDGYVNIAAQTAWTYTLTAADEGATVRVLVTATNPDATISEASQPTVTVLGAGPVNQTPPVLAGAAQRASTLTASPGVWGGLGNSYAYQWQRSPDGSTWSDISGQTFSSYVVGTADEGNAVRVLVTATNADGVAAVRERADGHDPECRARQQCRADGDRRGCAGDDAHLQSGDLDRHRQRVRVSVAALRRRQHLDQHRRRDGVDLRAHHSRRGRAGAGARHGHEPGRNAHRAERAHGDRAGLGAEQHDRSDDRRLGAAWRHADGHAGRVGRHRQYATHISGSARRRAGGATSPAPPAPSTRLPSPTKGTRSASR